MSRQSHLITLLFWVLGMNLGYAQNEAKDKWKVVIVAATEEPNIATASTSFVERSQQHFMSLASLLNLEADITIISGRDLNPSRMQELEAALTSSSSTQYKLFTWFSFTHGFNLENTHSKFPYLIAHPTKTILSDGEMRYGLPLEGFYDNLLASGNFEHVHLWAELCNQVCKGCGKHRSENLASLSGMGGKKAVEDVLYSRSGSLIVSSAYGQSSCASVTGGPFQQAILEAFSMMERGEWHPQSFSQATPNFIELVKQLTTNYLGELPVATCAQQTPISRIE